MLISTLGRWLAIALLVTLFVLSILWFGTKNTSGYLSEMFINSANATEMGITNDSNNDSVGEDSLSSSYVVATNTIPVPPVPPKPKVINTRVSTATTCSCVLFVKTIVGDIGLVGAGKNWPINSDVPVIGGVVVFKGTQSNPYGHVAYLEGIVGNTGYIYQSNYIRCMVNRDTIDLSDPDIKGFWKP